MFVFKNSYFCIEDKNKDGKILMWNNTQPEQPTTETLELLEEINETNTTFPYKVILFNDDWHTFDEVVNQIIKATKVDIRKAEELTWEVHSKGQSCVFDGELNECLKVSGILEEIALHTQIEC